MTLIEANYKNKTVLITGATGFIGQHLMHKLGRIGAKVIGTSRSKIENNKDFEQLNLNNKQQTEALINKLQPHYVFHLAAQKSRDSSLSALDASIHDNMLGSLNLFTANTNNPNLNAVISLGTIDEYGRALAHTNSDCHPQPATPYGLSKYCVSILAEMLAREYQLPIMTLRPSLAYGPRQDVDMFIPALIQSLLNGQAFPMTAGEQTRDFIYIDDLVEGILTAGCQKSFIGKTLNIGAGVSRKLRDVVAIITSNLQASHLVELGAVPYRNGEIMNYQVDSSELLSNTNWKPLTSLEDGLRKTIDYYQKLND